MIPPTPAPPGPPPPAGSPARASRLQGRLLVVALILTGVLGNEVLVLSLQGRISALQIVHRDPTGAAFEAAPDPPSGAHPAGIRLDYATGMDSARAARAGIPAATRADRGLEDLRRDIRWVRGRLRTGDTYAKDRWRFEDAMAAAADTARRFFCFSYACAMVSLAEAQGYTARVVYLVRHITSEVYLPESRQWVLADATYGVIPHGAEGGPLSILETHRRLVAGRPVDWRTVVGEAGDDATLDEPTRLNLESMLRAGDFLVKDGALTFGQRGDHERVMDVLRGRPSVIQLALDGQPPLDREERRLRGALWIWNIAGLTVLGAVMTVLLRRSPAR